MRYTDPAIQARRASRSGIISHALIHVWAKDRISGDVRALGLWTGDDHQQFLGRTYYAAGNVLDVPPLRTEIGLEVRRYTIGLSAISPEVEQLLRGYEPKGAPVEIHRAEFDDNGNLIAAPELLFSGWVNGAPISTPAIGGGMPSASLICVSNSRMLTVFGNRTKSDSIQSQRAGDRFRRYASAVKSAEIFWGQSRPRPALGQTIVERRNGERSSSDR